MPRWYGFVGFGIAGDRTWYLKITDTVFHTLTLGLLQETAYIRDPSTATTDEVQEGDMLRASVRIVR